MCSTIVVCTGYMLFTAHVSITKPSNKSENVNEGGKMLLECDCEVGGQVEWLHNKTVIKGTDSRYSIHEGIPFGEDKIRYSLVVRQMTSHDAGLFTCRQSFSDHVTVRVHKMEGIL